MKTRAGPLHQRRVGIVLGAGGMTGAAFHAGVLLALANDAGWEADRARVVVGTSAGSVGAFLVRSGLDAERIAGAVVRWEGAPTHLTRFWSEPALLKPLWRYALGVPARPSRRALRRAVGHLRRRDPLPLLSTVAPSGSLDLAPHLPEIPDEWPDRPTLVTAVRADSLERVVFGRDAFPSPRDAVLASCAVPAITAGHVVDGVLFRDGGVHSPTNADLLLGEEIDLAIVSSPLSAEVSGFHPARSLAALARAKLDREHRLLASAGTDVIRMEPDREARRLMGHDPFDYRRAPAALRAGFFLAGRRLRQYADGRPLPVPD